MSLKFDGKSNWKAFYAKFSRYAEVSEWTEEECRDQLCWCLDGKASEYYAKPRYGIHGPHTETRKMVWFSRTPRNGPGSIQ